VSALSLETRYRATHLARSNKTGGCLPAEKDREAICTTCKARITIGTDGNVEYGHKYGCAERPEHLPCPPRFKTGGEDDGV